MSSKTTNLGLTKPAEDEFYDVDVQNKNMDKIDAEIGGLENPSYEEADKTAKLVSGEKYTIAFGKIAKAISTLIDHISAKATSSVLGHVKLSDSTSSTSAASAGVAATPKAVKTAYDLANENSRKIGTTDISGIGDGTLTGAVDALNQSMSMVYTFTPSLDGVGSSMVSVKAGTTYTVIFDKSIKNDLIETNSTGNYFSILKEGIYHISMHEISGGELSISNSDNTVLYRKAKAGAYEGMEFYININKKSTDNDNWFLMKFIPDKDHTFYRDQRHCWLTIAYIGKNVA